MARAEAVHPHLQRACDSATPYSPFTVLVFAELLRLFGARSETKSIWRMSLFTNIQLVTVIAFSIGLQVWSQHNEKLGAFLKTEYMPFTDALILFAIGAIPLLILEAVKVVRNARQQNAR